MKEELFKWAKKHPILAGFSALIVIGIIWNILLPEENTNIIQEDSTIVESYKLLDKETLSLVQNIDVLLLSTDTSEAFITSLITDIERKECSKDCNIMVYDNEEAFNYQEEYDSFYSFSLSVEEFQIKTKEWDKKNYVFVAGHFL